MPAVADGDLNNSRFQAENIRRHLGGLVGLRFAREHRRTKMIAIDAIKRSDDTREGNRHVALKARGILGEMLGEARNNGPLRNRQRRLAGVGNEADGTAGVLHGYTSTGINGLTGFGSFRNRLMFSLSRVKS